MSTLFKPRLMIRLIAWVLIVFSVFLLIIIGAFQNPWVKQAAFGKLIVAVKDKTGWLLEIENIHGFLPFHLTAKNIKLSKEDNTVLLADRIEMALSPLELLQGKVVISFVDAENVRCFLPEDSTLDQQNPPSQSFSEMQFSIPFNAKLETIRIHHFSLQNNPSSFSLSTYHLSGQLELDKSKQAIFLNLVMSDANKTTVPTVINLSVSKQNHELSLALQLIEMPQGLVQSYFDPSIPIGVEVNVSASCPLKTLLTIGRRNKKTETEAPIKGNFAFQSYLQLQKESLISPALQIEGDFQIHADSSFDINRCTGSFQLFAQNELPISLSGELHVNSQFEIEKGKLSIQQFDAAPLSQFLIPKIEGVFLADCRLSGQISSPIFSIGIGGKGLKIGTCPIENFVSKITITGFGNHFEGQSELTCEIAKIPFQASSHFSWNHPSILTISHLSIQLPSSTLRGDIRLSFENFMLSGLLQGNIQDLVPLSSIFNTPLEGALAIQAEFAYDILTKENPINDDRMTQKLNLSILGENLSFADWEIEALKCSSRLLDPFGSIKGDLIIQAKEMMNDQMVWEEISLETLIDKEKTSWPFSLSSTGMWHGEAQIFASGNWRLTRQALDLRLEIFNGKIGGYPYALLQPTELRVESHSFDLAPLTIEIGTGEIHGFFNLSEDRIKTTCQMHRIPLHVMNLLIFPAAKIEGLGSIDLSLYGSLDHLFGHVKTQLKEVRIQEDVFAKFPAMHANFEAELKENLFQSHGKIEGEGMHPVIVHAELPLHLSSSPFVITIDDQKPLKANIEAEGEIASILELLVTDTVSITGYAKTALKIAGSWNKPEIEGTLKIENGSYENLDTGAIFQKFSILIEGHQQELFLRELQATDGNCGWIKGSGKMLLDRSAHFPFEGELDIHNSTLVHLDYAQAAASGYLTFKGDAKKGFITGDLTLNEATISIPEEIPPQLKTIEITYVNLPTLKEPYQPSKRKEKWPIELNIMLRMPCKAYVNGRDLKSEWRGELEFTGTATNPLINGAAKIINGEYLFNGRSFVSNKGTITFVGEPKKTSLYIIAEQQIDDIRMEIILRGIIRDPVISFRSNPPLSQKEILSWILFNRGIAEITPLQGAQLSQSVFTLSGGKGSPDVLSKIRNSIGIDRLDISSTDTEDSNEVSLRVGKYISQGIFVSLNKSINADANQVAIEAKMTRHFKISAEVGDNADGKISLKWTKDY